MKSVYLRFNSFKWVNEFRKGNIRFSCPLAYQKIENPAVGDRLEGIADEIVTNCSPDNPPEFAKPLIKALRKNILSNEITFKQSCFYPKAHKDRILCLYKLDLDDEKIITSVSIKNKLFDYDSFIVVYDVSSLFEQVKIYFTDKQNYKFRIGEVSYSNISMGRSVFDKPMHLCYQNELRILITDNNISDYNNGIYVPLDISIGDISGNTSEIFDIESLFTAKTVDDFILKSA